MSEQGNLEGVSEPLRSSEGPYWRAVIRPVIFDYQDIRSPKEPRLMFSEPVIHRVTH